MSVAPWWRLHQLGFRGACFNDGDLILHFYFGACGGRSVAYGFIGYFLIWLLLVCNGGRLWEYITCI